MIAAKKRAKELSREIRDLEKTISTSSRLAESKKRELKKCEAIAGVRSAKQKGTRSSTDLAMGVANVRAGTRYPPEH